MSARVQSEDEWAVYADHLEVRLPGRQVPLLKAASFKIQKRARTYIVGKSGVGKSTLINVAVGLHPWAGGGLRVLRWEVVPAVASSEDEKRRMRAEIGVLYETGALFDSIPLLDNIMFPLVHAPLRENRKSAEEARHLAEEALEVVDLEPELWGKMPFSLSTGERKRGGLARAIVTKPKVLLCDEPTAGLDPPTADIIDHLLLHLSQRSPDLTLVVVSHDCESIKAVAEQVIFFHREPQGSTNSPPKPSYLHKAAALEDFLQETEDPVIRDFFQRKGKEKSRVSLRV